ncbi:MAG: YhbY family RNA-binding protein [Sphaerochaetaceae bacterium]
MDSDFRSFLRNQGQTLAAVVMVGKKGFEDNLVKHLDQALSTQELVKVKFQAHKDEARDISEHLAQEVKGEVVTQVGFNTLVYRDSDKHLMQKAYKK